MAARGQHIGYIARVSSHLTAAVYGVGRAARVMVPGADANS
jgi:hypothetical protein